MGLKDDVRNALPPFRDEVRVITDRQTTGDIIRTILKTHQKYARDYDKIEAFFDTGDVYDTGRKIWDFLKYNLIYDAERGKQQSVKSPAAILTPGLEIDCKHYSLFAGGLLDAIKRRYNESWTWCYRFVSDKSDRSLGHVFIVIEANGKSIWLDPVLSAYDQRKKYTATLDKTPMALVEISGTTPDILTGKPVTNVNKAVAWQSFLASVKLNLFAWADLLKSNPTIVHGPVKAYCAKNGYDFDQLLAFISSAQNGQ